jgi:hypothetical protein
MPAFDELRNELDALRDNQHYTVNDAFHKLVHQYHGTAEKIEQLVLFQEQLEQEGHQVTWPTLST